MVAKRRGTQKRRAVEMKSGRLGCLCFVCGESIDLTLRDPDPMSATVEHIFPRCLGGGNAKVNCSVSHKSCNNARNLDDERSANYLRTMWRQWAQYTQVASYVRIPRIRLVAKSVKKP